MTVQHLARTMGAAALARAAARNRFDCTTCGRGVGVDEDGCCRTCGRDARPVVWRDPTVAKLCVVCRQRFFASKQNAKTCSARCRQMAHRLGRPVTAPSQQLSQHHAATPAFWPELAVIPRPVTPAVTPVSQQAAVTPSLFDALDVPEVPMPAPLAVVVLKFPTVGTGGAIWELREDQVAAWQALYPGLDVLGQVRQALAWIMASPDRRKTTGGMGKFLVNWLNRSVDRPRLAGAVAPKTAGNKAGIEEFLRRRLTHGVDGH